MSAVTAVLSIDVSLRRHYPDRFVRSTASQPSSQPGSPSSRVCCSPSTLAHGVGTWFIRHDRASIVHERGWPLSAVDLATVTDGEHHALRDNPVELAQRLEGRLRIRDLVLHERRSEIEFGHHVSVRCARISFISGFCRGPDVSLIRECLHSAVVEIRRHDDCAASHAS